MFFIAVVIISILLQNTFFLVVTVTAVYSLTITQSQWATYTFKSAKFAPSREIK